MSKYKYRKKIRKKISVKVSFHIPELWVFNVLNRVRKKCAEYGIYVTNADIMSSILLSYLSLYATPDDFEVPTKFYRLTAEDLNVVEFKKKPKTDPHTGVLEDAWVISCVQEIVETKKLAGINTSFAKEITRLAGNQLADLMSGRTLDLLILSRYKTKILKMFIIHKIYLDAFLEYLRTVHSVSLLMSSRPNVEITRFMLGDSLFIIRPMPEIGSESYEVWCSNKEVGKFLQKEWEKLLQEFSSQEEMKGN